MVEDKDFYTAVLTAGPILTGFSGSFLQFRIQREAGYYRQPSPDGRDNALNLTHFTASFLLIICCTMLALIFGFLLPLAHIGGLLRLPSRGIVVSGLFASMAFLIGYFVSEMIHYDIRPNKLKNDAIEWQRQRWIIGLTLLFAVLLALVPLVSRVAP
jgi:uncharacterized BrkB/YihY/UPF0761 family membrane protein